MNKILKNKGTFEDERSFIKSIKLDFSPEMDNRIL